MWNVAHKVKKVIVRHDDDGGGDTLPGIASGVKKNKKNRVS